MGNKHLRWLCSLLGVMLLFLTGCWDRVEIEERGFILAIAIDTIEEGKKLSIVQQLALPSGLQGSASGGGGGGGQKPYLNITQEGSSVVEILSDTVNKLSRVPYYQHNRVIIISQELAQTPALLRDILDPFLRDEEMRRGVRVLISEGPAKAILEIATPVEALPAKFIDLQSDNVTNSLKMAKPVHIGNIQQFMMRRQSFGLQKIVGKGEEILINGMAIFHGDDATLVGFLSPDETVGVNFITGKVEGGIMRINQNDEKFVAIEILDFKHQIEVDTSDKERITFNIHIEAETQGAQLTEDIDTQNAKEITKLEEQFGKEIERIVMEVAEKLQQEYKADVLGLGERVRISNYQLWQQIKDDWDRGRNFFSKSEIQVKAEVNIRHFQNIQHSYKSR